MILIICIFQSEKTSSKDSRSCKYVDDEEPQSYRNGDKYYFGLYKKNAKCVDKNGNLYEYGQFNNVRVSNVFCQCRFV